MIVTWFCDPLNFFCPHQDANQYVDSNRFHCSTNVGMCSDFVPNLCARLLRAPELLAISLAKSIASTLENRDAKCFSFQTRIGQKEAF